MCEVQNFNMSVLIETSIGNIVIDLLDENILAYNFIKLCKLKYYFFSPFFGLKQDQIVKCGVPEYPTQLQSAINKFTDISEKYPGISGDLIDVSDLKLDTPEPSVGLVSFTKFDNHIKSEFSIILSSDKEVIETLMSTQLPFGKIKEGFNTLLKINHSGDLKVRILHTHILSDPFPDPDNFINLIPKTLFPTEVQLKNISETDLKIDTTIEALTLELIGDLPHYNVKPAPNVLFITKLNPITRDDALEVIFSRFGPVNKCTIVKDKTGKSKRYGFIEFETERDAEIAYDKLSQGCIIDGNEIIVDFSQSTRDKH